MANPNPSTFLSKVYGIWKTMISIVSSMMQLALSACLKPYE